MGKNIIVASDGTGNEFGVNNTNVVKIFSLAYKGDTQICFYDPGVGTGDWTYDEKTNIIKSTSDKATGVGLQKNVEDAYKFLMWTYDPGDQIFLFGFSRGAFTIRALAGMLKKVGLLHNKFDLNMLEYASKIYNTPNNIEIAQGFKDTFSRPCPVYFIGVWDTVESLAMSAGKRFYDYKLDPTIKYAYQALSIDEKRADFPPCLWDEIPVDGQVMEQVFFIGCHSDVGGWYLDSDLSDIALKWMVKNAIKAGMKFNPTLLAEFFNKPENPQGIIHESYNGIWKIRSREVRVIPEGSKIHKSVFQRKDYHPENLPIEHEVVE